MERSTGGSCAPMPHILRERLLRRLDEDTGIVRPERKVRIEFQQLVNEPRDFTAASVPRCDSERAQERHFERPVLREKRRSVFWITHRGEIFQQETEGTVLGGHDVHYLLRDETHPQAYRRSSVDICGVPHHYAETAVAAVRRIESYDALTPDRRQDWLVRPDWSQILGLVGGAHGKTKSASDDQSTYCNKSLEIGASEHFQSPFGVVSRISGTRSRRFTLAALSLKCHMS